MYFTLLRALQEVHAGKRDGNMIMMTKLKARPRPLSRTRAGAYVHGQVRTYTGRCVVRTLGSCHTSRRSTPSRTRGARSLVFGCACTIGKDIDFCIGWLLIGYLVAGDCRYKKEYLGMCRFESLHTPHTETAAKKSVPNKHNHSTYFPFAFRLGASKGRKRGEQIRS
jgi:hypothetical protein